MGKDAKRLWNDLDSDLEKLCECCRSWNFKLNSLASFCGDILNNIKKILEFRKKTLSSAREGVGVRGIRGILKRRGLLEKDLPKDIDGVKLFSGVLSDISDLSRGGFLWLGKSSLKDKTKKWCLLASNCLKGFVKRYNMGLGRKVGGTIDDIKDEDNEVVEKVILDGKKCGTRASDVSKQDDVIEDIEKKMREYEKEMKRVMGNDEQIKLGLERSDVSKQDDVIEDIEKKMREYEKEMKRVMGNDEQIKLELEKIEEFKKQRKEEKEKAATKINKVFRGWSTRKKIADKLLKDKIENFDNLKVVPESTLNQGEEGKELLEGEDVISEIIDSQDEKGEESLDSKIENLEDLKVVPEDSLDQYEEKEESLGKKVENLSVASGMMGEQNNEESLSDEACISDEQFQELESIVKGQDGTEEKQSEEKTGTTGTKTLRNKKNRKRRKESEKGLKKFNKGKSEEIGEKKLISRLIECYEGQGDHLVGGTWRSWPLVTSEDTISGWTKKDANYYAGKFSVEYSGKEYSICVYNQKCKDNSTKEDFDGPEIVKKLNKWSNDGKDVIVVKGTENK